jgi:hypothetical protein
MKFRMRIWALVVMLLAVGGWLFLFSGVDVLGSFHATITGENNKNLEDNAAGGEVGHWTFHGKDLAANVADVSGNGNNGRLINFTATTTVPGPLGQALNFTVGASSQHVIVNDATNLRITDDITIAAWVRRTNPTHAAGILAKTNNITDDFTFTLCGAGAANICNGTDNGLEFEYTGAGGSTKISRGSQGAGAPGLITDSKWHHVAVTRARGTFNFYIDGVLVYTPAVEATAFQSTASNVYLGNVNTNIVSTQIDGSLDDVRLYNRALSATEIKRLHGDTPR